MNELQIFENPKFGAVRTIEEDGRILFCGSDIARALGYASPKDAILRHCKGALIRRLPTNGGEQDMKFIPEGDIYRLAAKSELPGADEFERWIFDEVLPSIRKHGAYVAPNAALSDAARQALAEAKLNNSRARLSSVWLKLAQQVNLPEYRQICMSYASGVLAGKPVLPLPEGGQRHYTATEIGKMFGVSARKIGDLAKANGIKCEQFGKWYHDKSPYSAKEVDTFRYNDAAIGQFERLLKGAGKAG